MVGDVEHAPVGCHRLYLVVLPSLRVVDGELEVLVFWSQSGRTSWAAVDRCWVPSVRSRRAFVHLAEASESGVGADQEAVPTREATLGTIHRFTVSDTQPFSSSISFAKQQSQCLCWLVGQRRAWAE